MIISKPLPLAVSTTVALTFLYLISDLRLFVFNLLNKYGYVNECVVCHNYDIINTHLKDIHYGITKSYYQT